MGVFTLNKCIRNTGLFHNDIGTFNVLWCEQIGGWKCISSLVSPIYPLTFYVSSHLRVPHNLVFMLLFSLIMLTRYTRFCITVTNV